MRRPFNQIQPAQAVAVCSHQQAEQLADYDHHVVQVNGRDGVMLTSAWIPVEEHTGPFLLTVVFREAEKHSPAPGEFQAIVYGLSFQVRGQPR